MSATAPAKRVARPIMSCTCSAVGGSPVRPRYTRRRNSSSVQSPLGAIFIRSRFTPTSSSWLNLVERWFKELTDRRLRRGSFSSVDALKDAIELWTEHWNDDPKPFVWHKTATEIIEKVRRGRDALTQAKSATHH